MNIPSETESIASEEISFEDKEVRCLKSDDVDGTSQEGGKRSTSKKIPNDGTLSQTTTREISGSHPDSESSSIVESGKGHDDESPYTLLSYGQKWGMVALLTMCTFWSSLGSPIYYPALKQLEKQFNIDENMVNVTVVVYLLFQGIAPTVSGGLADIYGRRPVIVIGMVIYVAVSVGLACCNSYGVIVFLRCVQSACISPTIAISSGVVGDFTLKFERGTFVGATSGFALLGQAFGSLIGAALAAAWDWRAIFWFLVIGCGASLAIVFTLLPETKRTLVGNLSIRPKNILNRAPIFLLKPVQRRFRYDNPDYDTVDKNVPKLDLTSAFKITAQPEIILSLFPAGLQFAMWTLMLSALSSELLASPYNYKLTIVGVCYLPAGIGGLVGSFVTGKIIDIYYKKLINKFQKGKEEGNIAPDAQFNTIKARLAAALPQNFISVISFLLFGWSVDQGWPIAAVLVTSCISSFCTMSTLSTSSTLLVDLYPSKSSTATSCFNFIRCTLSAIFMGCFAKMKSAMTVGGTFSFLCGLVFVGNFLLLVPMNQGMKWRQQRALKAQLACEKAFS